MHLSRAQCATLTTAGPQHRRRRPIAESALRRRYNRLGQNARPLRPSALSGWQKVGIGEPERLQPRLVGLNYSQPLLLVRRYQTDRSILMWPSFGPVGAEVAVHFASSHLFVPIA